jgi:hypothetical protein
LRREEIGRRETTCVVRRLSLDVKMAEPRQPGLGSGSQYAIPAVRSRARIIRSAVRLTTVSPDSTPPDTPPWAQEATKLSEKMSRAIRVLTSPPPGVGQAIAESLRSYEALIKPELQRSFEHIRRDASGVLAR